MKSKIAILIMPFIHSLYFKENLLKSKIAMFNLNRKSTFSATLLALILGASVFLAGERVCPENRHPIRQFSVGVATSSKGYKKSH